MLVGCTAFQIGFRGVPNIIRDPGWVARVLVLLRCEVDSGHRVGSHGTVFGDLEVMDGQDQLPCLTTLRSIVFSRRGLIAKSTNACP
jgi:hypothetical protein